MTPIDWNKPVQTKDGRKFTYVGRGPNLHFPIVGYIEDWSRAEQWTEKGLFTLAEGHANDLINVPEKH